MKIQRKLSLLILFYCANAKVLHERISPTHSRLGYSSNDRFAADSKISGLFESAEEKPRKHALHKVKPFSWLLKEQSEFKNDHLVPYADLKNKISDSISKANRKLRKHEKKKKLQIQANTKQTRTPSRSKRSVQINEKPAEKPSSASCNDEEEGNSNQQEENQVQESPVEEANSTSDDLHRLFYLFSEKQNQTENYKTINNKTNIQYKTINKEKAIEDRILVTSPPLVRLNSSPENREEDNNTNIKVEESVHDSLYAFLKAENKIVENTFNIAKATDRTLGKNETNIDFNTEESPLKIIKSVPIKHLETSKENIEKQLKNNTNITEIRNATFEELDLHRLLHFFPIEDKQNGENINKTSTIEQKLASVNNITNEDTKIITKEDTNRKYILEEAISTESLEASQENKKDNKIMVDCTNLKDDQIKQTLAEYVNFDSVILLNSAEKDTLNINLDDTVGSQEEAAISSTNQPISLKNVTTSSFSYKENLSRNNGTSRKNLEEEKSKTMERRDFRPLENYSDAGINKTRGKMIKEKVSPINPDTTKEMSSVSKNKLKAKHEKLATTERLNLTKYNSDLSLHVQSNKTIVNNSKNLQTSASYLPNSNRKNSGETYEDLRQNITLSSLDVMQLKSLLKWLFIVLNRTKTEIGGLSRGKGNANCPNVKTPNEESSNEEPEDIRTTKKHFTFQTFLNHKTNHTEINTNTEAPSRLASYAKKPDTILKWLSIVINRTQTDNEGLTRCKGNANRPIKTTNEGSSIEKSEEIRAKEKPFTFQTVFGHSNNHTEINTNTEAPSRLDSNAKKTETILKWLSIVINRTQTEIEGLFRDNANANRPVKTTNEESSIEKPKEIRTTEKPITFPTVFDHKNNHSEITINAEPPNRPDLNSKKPSKDVAQVVPTMKAISNSDKFEEMSSQTENLSGSTPSDLSTVAKNEEGHRVEPDLGKCFNKTCIINIISNVNKTKPLKSADQAADTLEASKTPKKPKLEVEVSRRKPSKPEEEVNKYLVSENEPKYGTDQKSRKNIETILNHSLETFYEYSVENEKSTYANKNNDTTSSDHSLLEYDDMCDLKLLATSVIPKRVLNLCRRVCGILGRLYKFPKRIFFDPLLRIYNRVLNILNKIINSKYFVGSHNRNQGLAIYHKTQNGKESHKQKGMSEEKVSRVLRIVALVLNTIRSSVHEQQCDDSYTSKGSHKKENDSHGMRSLMRRRRHLKNTGKMIEHKISSKHQHILNLLKLKSIIEDILKANSLHDHINHKSKPRLISSTTAQKLHKTHRHASDTISNMIKRHVDPEKSNNKISNSVRYRTDLDSNESNNSSDENEDIPLYPHKNVTSEESPTNTPEENGGTNSNTLLGPMRVGMRSFIGDLINARVYDLIEYIADIFKTFLTNLLTKLFNFGFGGADMILYVGLAISVGISSGIMSGVVMLIGSAFIRLISFDSIPTFMRNIVTTPFRYLFQDILSIINDLNFGVIFKKLYIIMLNIYHRVVTSDVTPTN